MYSKITHWFHISLTLHVRGIFMCTVILFPKGPISGPKVKVEGELIMSLLLAATLCQEANAMHTYISVQISRWFAWLIDWLKDHHVWQD